MRSDNAFSKSLFQPSVIRSAYGNGSTKNISLAGNALIYDEQDAIYDSNKKEIPFFYDQFGTPLRSTQQLNVDFSLFENHTFFNSARVKTQIAIQKIINKFPFDGKRVEYEKFISDLSGFEKYVLDSFPKSLNYINFKGYQFIKVSDRKGSKQASDDFKKIGRPALDISLSPFTIEFYLRLPEKFNDNMVIVQRLEQDQSNGFTIGIKQSSSIDTANIFFLLTSNGQELKIEIPFAKGDFKHVAMIYDRDGNADLKCYIDGDLKIESSNAFLMGEFDYSNSDLYIGDGFDHSDFEVQQKLEASLDELRIFNIARSAKLINKHRNKSIFAEDGLNLYFKFNEPDWSNIDSSNKDLILDSSGNALHSRIITNGLFDDSIRSKIDNVSTPLKSEDEEKSPILFLDYDPVQIFLQNILEEAEIYDVNNPNLITKMVPPHYLFEASYSEGIQIEDDYLSDYPINQSNQPGTAQQPQNNVMASMLYAWAEVFDDIKIFIDELGRLLKVDYIDDKTISGHLIPFLANYHGFVMPSLTSGPNIGQLLFGEGLDQEDTKSFLGMLEIQNTIWRRILSDLVELRKTKGTINSIKSLLRNIGINPNGAIRIKEYGGSNFRYINDSLEKRENMSRALVFRDSENQLNSFDDGGVYQNLPLLRTPFLVSPRVEPGFPPISGDQSFGASNEQNDTLLTSGSWTFEGIFKIPNQKNNTDQSLMRLQTVGLDSDNNQVLNHVLFNVVASPPNAITQSDGKLTLWINFDNENTITASLENVNVFDDKQWYVSFGRERHYNDGKIGSTYHLRANKIKLEGNDPIKSDFVNSYNEDENENAQQQFNDLKNKNGAYLAIGSIKIDENFNANYYLNGSNIDEALTTNFNGKVTHIRFYTKHLSKKESQTHANNFRSAGVDDPKLNFNFIDHIDGSYERLRLEYTMEQINENSDEFGNIEIFDFSQNELHGIGTGFNNTQKVIFPEKFYYNVINPKLESASNSNKVRIRSFKNIDNAIRYDTDLAPLYELPGDDRPNDDRRIEIEASLVQALNDDIATIFASLDSFNNYIGAPELVFSREYRDLRNLRKIYFNRLTDRINIKNFFEFFKWFDETIGDIIEQLIPYNSKYLGTNFIIESHALERPKFTYSYQEMYLGEIDRRPSSTIFLQQFVANLRKF